MGTLIEICKRHTPSGGDPRIFGRKLKEIGKYVSIAAMLAAAGGFYIYYVEGLKFTDDIRWGIALGVALVLGVGQLVGLLELQKLLSVVLWIVAVVSGHFIRAGGVRDDEIAIVLLSISGTLLVIALTMIIKGNVLLKTYL